MQKLFLIPLISLMLFSCEKTKKYPWNPDWLDDRIPQMETYTP
jgi:hypothetical protein